MDTPALPSEFSTDAYLAELIDTLRDLDRAAVDRIAWLLYEAQRAGRTVFVCGNGGSAAVASHWAADLSKVTAKPGRPRLRVLALTDSVEAITAAANDVDYSEVFAEQLRTFMHPDDVVIGISTSGRSPNVLRALEFANESGGISVGITGLGGEPLRRIAHETLVVTSYNVQRIEDVAAIAVHLTSSLTRQRLEDADAVLVRTRASGNGADHHVAFGSSPLPAS